MIDANPQTLTRAQLEQLFWYAVDAENQGHYYGVREHFDARHAAIMAWLRRAIAEAKP